MEDNRSRELRILSANVRGLRTNLGDLTHTPIRSVAEVVICCENFLDDSKPPTRGQIQGYIHWYRRDRPGQGGGIALCHKLVLYIQCLNIDTPGDLEIMFHKLCISHEDNILLTACYRPHWQGSVPLKYLRDNLGTLLINNGCSISLIAGDLKHKLVQRSCDQLLLVHDLYDHVDFSTHVLRSSLDPDLCDFSSLLSSCESLSHTGSPDHNAVLTCFNVTLPTNREPYGCERVPTRGGAEAGTPKD